MVIEACGVVGFASFVAAGLRSAGAGTPRRLAFFTLDDLVARSLLERLSAQVLFGTLERSLGIYTAALWGARPVMHVATPRQDAPAPRRVSIAGGIIRVPEGFRGVPVEVAPSLFRAAIAHATAHLALGDGRFRPGGLKPVQLALVGLIEDARVEALAMRRFPGLRRLFAPFHVAEPVGVSTAPALLARLARALFDPDYRDDSGFIAKGRTLFAAELERLDDADLSRRIGGLLGNDLGQMRIQFNAKTYVVEPAYRDDGLGLWDFTTPPDVSPEDIEVPVEAVRVDRRDNGDRPDRHHDEPEPNGDAAGRAHAAPADDLGTAVATYPEWDRAAGIERADWTTIRDVPPIYGDAATIEAALARETSLRRRIERLVRGAKVGRTVRLRRQEDGVDLDLDAALDAAVALRAGEMPADRIHRTIAPKTRDLTTLILIDMSESTRERAAPSGATVLDVEKAAVALLAQAMERLGDPFALRAFASNGRDEVRLVRLSEFGEDFDAGAKARLAGLRSGLSTRLGAALRHAGAELAPVRAYRKIVLALTDGEPADIDVGDPLDLIEDARRAVRGLKARGIDVFGITLDPAGQGSGTAVFGRTNHMPVCRIEELPARLSELYFRLARR